MKVKRIGITGGIGSGKSLICKIFSSLGYQIYEADARAKWLMINQPELVAGVKALFGEEAYFSDGALNRKYIGEIVFNDPTQLEKLNKLVHPQTGKDFENWADSVETDYNKPFVLKEAAILFESGAYKASDAVITVYAPKNVRLERVIKRDANSREAVLQRMDKQWPEWKKIRHADFVIINDGNHLLIPQVRKAIEFFN